MSFIVTTFFLFLSVFHVDSCRILQTDIILEPGQKVIISCDAACTMRENPHGIKENMYIDTFLNEVAGKKDSYCVHENRVPNIFLRS